MNRKLTHFDDEGRTRMVDVGAKPVTDRMAVASGQISMTPETLEIIRAGTAKKGDVLTVAELAGIMGAKQTSSLIPLCHPLPVSGAKAQLELDDDLPGVTVTMRVKTTGQTGVEMEALTGVTIACLTIYDMMKAVDRGMVIGEVRLIEKSGGASGDYKRDN